MGTGAEHSCSHVLELWHDTPVLSGKAPPSWGWSWDPPFMLSNPQGTSVLNFQGLQHIYQASAMASCTDVWLKLRNQNPCLAHISIGHFHMIQRRGGTPHTCRTQAWQPCCAPAQAKSQVLVSQVGKSTARLTASAGENRASLDSRGNQGEETQHWHWQDAISPPPPSPHAATGLYFYHFRASVLKKQERFFWRKIKLKFIFLFSLERPLSFCTSIIHYVLSPSCHTLFSDPDKTTYLTTGNKNSPIPRMYNLLQHRRFKISSP